MDRPIEFETPENVRIQYELAGLGTRFIAWLCDMILLVGLIVVMAILLMFTAYTMESFNDLFGLGSFAGEEDDAQAALYMIGLMFLFIGLGSFFYFGLFELFMRGQTPGKKSVSIRVVKADGFALDAGGVMLRNIFRVVDHLPPLWIVPLLSAKSQRLGDMAAGTLLISEKPQQLGDLREYVTARPAEEQVFRFDGVLNRVGPKEVHAAEQVLDRTRRSRPEHCAEPLQLLCDALARQLDIEPPAPELRAQFLEDFLAAEYRRQNRQLG